MISIIMPVFNREHLISETLDSIKKQTFTDWECIIVDDESTDHTVAVIEKYIEKDNRFKLFNRPSDKPKGPSACRNFAFEKMKGDYIQFFDSDDIMHSEHLSSKVDAIKDADFVVCKLKKFKREFDEDFFLLDDISDIKSTNNVFEDFVSGKFSMMMVAPMWRKTSLMPYMPIREDLHILEDYDLYARALFEKKKFKIINQCLIFYRIGQDSSTNTFYNNIDFGLESYFQAKKTVLKLTSSTSVKLIILRMTLGFLRMGLAQKKYRESERCIDFINNEKLAYSLKLKIQFIRIQFFYYIFKIIRRGDNKFKFLLKL